VIGILAIELPHERETAPHKKISIVEDGGDVLNLLDFHLRRQMRGLNFNGMASFKVKNDWKMGTNCFIRAIERHYGSQVNRIAYLQVYSRQIFLPLR
jgi:hypothetical protein